VPKPPKNQHWRDRGSHYVARSYYANRNRAASDKGRALLRRRGEKLERTFAHACETGGHRRVRLRGQANVRKRYLIQIAAMNLRLVMCALFGSGTPRQAADAEKARAGLFQAVLAAFRAMLTVASSAWSPFGSGMAVACRPDCPRVVSR
jgi:hypothetical protein